MDTSGTVRRFSPGARMDAWLDLPALEDRVRRDTGHVSLAVSALWIIVLVAAMYGVGWMLSLPTRFAATPPPDKRPRPPIETIDDPGKFGLAADLGDQPNADGDVQVEVADAAFVKELTEIVGLAEQNRDDAMSARNPDRVGGGPIGHDARGPGPGPDGPTAPRSDRWSIEWGVDTELGYRRKLDHFGILLGAVRSGQLVGAARGFSVARAETTMRPPSLWFIHRDRSRVELDRKLLSNAGVSVQPTDIVAQFFPAELQAKLESLETTYSHKNVLQIKRTVFGARPAGAGYEFFVVEQQLK